MDTMIEAMGDWELVKSQNFFVMKRVEEAPLPPETAEGEGVAEYREFLLGLKQQFAEQKKEIELTRKNRQEIAVFIKAKLMLNRRDMAVDRLFDMAALGTEQVRKDELALMTEFIQDMGVWKYWEDFKAQKSQSAAG
jgi:hypothetical protein